MKPHLVHVFPAFAGGGPEVRTADVINQSSAQFRHTIISMDGDVSGRQRLAFPADVKCSAAPRRSLWGLARLLRSHQAELVLTYGWGGTDALAAARLAGSRRIIHTEDGFLDDEIHSQKPKRQLARRLVFKAASAVVVPSLSLCDVARATWRIGASRLRYIPNGVDIGRFAPPSPEQKLSIRRDLRFPDDALVIGIVGALRPEKNQLRLLKAFSTVALKIPQARLLVVGDGPLMSSLQATAANRSLENRITFVGSVLNPARHYHAMDLLALSSDTEQMPLSILEGMASGLPIVSTDVGDVRRMVSELNRPFVVPIPEPAAYADACINLLRDGQLRSALGEKNRTRCATLYDWQGMLKAYTELYGEFIAGNGRVATPSIPNVR